MILCVIFLQCTSTRQMVQHRGGKPYELRHDIMLILKLCVYMPECLHDETHDRIICILNL